MSKQIVRTIAITALFLTPAVTQARCMNPNNGRFSTMDTYEGDQEHPFSQHKYLYCDGDPVDMADPNGHLAEVEVEVAIDITGWVLASMGVEFASGNPMAEIKQVAAALQVPIIYSKEEAQEQEEPNYYYFVHGTSTGSWGKSKRIDAAAGDVRYPGDFGLGFYTFATWDGLPAYNYAGERAIQTARFRGGVAFILGAKMKPGDYVRLSKIDFRLPQFAPAWGAFVNASRAGRQPAMADVIIGPVAKMDHVTRTWVANPHVTIPQYKFEAGGVAKLKPAFVIPIGIYQE